MLSIDPLELARCLFDEATDALFIFEPQGGTLVDANPVALRLTGYSRGELMDRQLS